MLQNSNAIEDGGYVIDRSLRFMSASSQYLTRTPSVAGNRRTWTWSCWAKRGALGSRNGLFVGNNTSGGNYLEFNPLNQLNFVGNDGTTPVWVRTTTQAFSDTSAWYHIVAVFDSTNSTASDRVKLFVNGVQLTSFTASTNPALNYETFFNQAVQHNIGRLGTPGFYFDGYQTEVHFIDGQALTPSSFGIINSATGQWVAKKYAGTYGTNGFYLDFKDGTSTTTLGDDKSGNNNHWTLTNFTRSAGVNDCWMLDVPAGNGSASAVQPSGNYAVLNPLANGGATVSQGNLLSITPTSITGGPNSTIGVKTGKWYWEVTSGSGNNISMIGIRNELSTPNNYPGSDTNGYSYYQTGGQKYFNAVGSAYGATWTTNDIIGVALDLDAGTLTFYKNNVSQGVAFTGIPSSTWFAAHGDGTTGATITADYFNFGQRSFAYTPPTGFKALCTANLPTPSIKKPSDHFNISLWTGNNSSSRAITGLNFSPDFTWIKCRSKNYNNHIVDSVREPTNSLISNSTNAQSTNSTLGYVSSLDSNGFTVNFGTSSGAQVNEVSQTYVAWNWRASDSIPVTNTDGSITSTVSVNPTTGFSIVTYTGTGANATVGHGLGIAPSVIIVKNATFAATYWCVQHKSLTAPSVLRLNDVTASASATNIWTSNNNTSLVFNIGAANETNRPTHTMVAYCFAEIAGYSKFGSYTGNGSADGPFVYTGFKPRWILIKLSSSPGSWFVYDTARDEFNVASKVVIPNDALAEDTSSINNIDITANGFKIRTTDGRTNSSGGTYIYMAFAETPFQYANAR